MKGGIDTYVALFVFKKVVRQKRSCGGKE